MAKKTEKTNVMRLLDLKGIPYAEHTYDPTLLNAAEVANALGFPPQSVFKTLVTQGKSKQCYVFMLPSLKELDLKKAAQAVGEKALEMLPQKELLPLTGYVHGGCSPIGMKKPFPTAIDQSALACESICFSAGRVGHQVQMSLDNLRKSLKINVFDIAKA